MSSNSARRVIPWRITLVICAVAAVLLLVAQQVAPHAGMVVLAGYSTGVLCALLSFPKTTLLTLLATFASVALCTVFPGPASAYMAVAVLITLAAYDAHATGSRAGIPAINGLLLYLLVPDEARSFGLLGIFALTAFIGVFVVRFEGATGAGTRDPLKKKHAVGLWVFLMAGLAVTLLLSHKISHQNAYWLSFLFVFRAMAPVDKFRNSILNFGIGVGLGALLAIALEYAGLPQQVMLGVGFLAILVGIRHLPRGVLVTGPLFTLATLLITAPTTELALFRIEAAMIVVVIASVLGMLIGWLWRVTED